MSRRSQGLNTLTGKTTCTTRFHCKSSDCVKNMIKDIEPLCSGAGHTTSSGTKRRSNDSFASRSHHHHQNKTTWMMRSRFLVSFENLCHKNNQMIWSQKHPNLQNFPCFGIGQSNTFGNGRTGYVGRKEWFLGLGNRRRKIGKNLPFISALHTFHGPCQVRVHFQQMSRQLNLEILETGTL